MSTSSINYEGFSEPARGLGTDLEQLSHSADSLQPLFALNPTFDLGNRTSQFDATLNALIAEGVLSGSGAELKGLFGQRSPSLDTPLNIMRASMEKVNQGREKRVADSLRSVLSHNFAETAQIFDWIDRQVEDRDDLVPLISRARVVDGRAVIGAAFPNRVEDESIKRLMDPAQDIVAPETAKTLVIDPRERTTDELILKLPLQSRTDRIILPSAKDLGFKGFSDHSAPTVIASVTPRHRAVLAEKNHLNAGQESAVQVTEIPLGSMLGGCGMNSVVSIPDWVMDQALDRLFMDAPTLEFSQPDNTARNHKVSDPLAHLEETGEPIIFPLLSGDDALLCASSLTAAPHHIQV